MVNQSGSDDKKLTITPKSDDQGIEPRLSRQQNDFKEFESLISSTVLEASK